MTNGVKKVPSSTIKGTSDSAIKKVQKKDLPIKANKSCKHLFCK